MLNFKEIASTPILGIVKALGITVTEKGEQFVGHCPISQLQNATAFKVTPSINRWCCFCTSCKKEPKRGGDVIELVRRIHRLADVREAAALVLKLVGGAGKLEANDRPQQEVADARKAHDFDPLAYLQTLDPAHDELEGLGISPATLTAYKAGYCNKGLNRGRLAVAVCDAEGAIKAFIGLALKGNEALQVPKGYTLPYWWGIDHVREGKLWVLPTILDVLSSADNGETNVICPLNVTTPDALTCLKVLMQDRNCTLEF